MTCRRDTPATYLAKDILVHDLYDFAGESVGRGSPLIESYQVDDFLTQISDT